MTRINPAEVLKAADHFADANGFAAQTYQGLKDVLGGHGQMAGDDQTSEDFAAEYDGAAADFMGAFADLVGALGGLARLVYLTAGNHRNANLASVYSENPPVYSGGQFDAPPGTTVTVAASRPPSVVGGDDPDTPELWDQITDYLEGWTWPGADTGRLRSAGESWRQVDSMFDTMLAPYVDAALGELRKQDSEDIDLAIGVIEDLKLEIDELGHQAAELGAACDAYAQQVDDVKEVVKGILRDLAIEVGISIGVGIVVGIFTAGIGAGGGAAIAGWRLASAARKVIHAFSAMKAVVKAGAVAKILTVARRVPILGRRFRRVSEAANRARHERYVDQLRAAMGKPATRDPKLTDLMDELYRDNAKVGSGSTAAAVRHELATGQLVGGRSHVQKAENMITALQRWLRNHPDATPGDRAAAENVIRDMQNALAGN
ncbi:MAG: hypothetical protein ACRDO4_17275 [Nocardioides sp.]